MRRIAPHIHKCLPQAIQPGNSDSRAGVTLTEVLMSLMIMSIGVSAVAVLFPISVLRSVQATQMTNAAILKYNTEALIQMRPELVFDPDGDGNLEEHIGRQGEDRYIVDPAGYYTMTDLGFPCLADPADPGNAGATREFADWFGSVDSNADGVPETFMGLPRFDGGIRSATRSVPLPLGLRADPNAFPDEARGLQALAATATKLGDGWVTVADTYADGFLMSDATILAAPSYGAPESVIGVRISSDVDLVDVPTSDLTVPGVAGSRVIADPEAHRVVVFSLDGSFSVSYPLLAIDTATNTVRWGETTEDLNSNGYPDVRRLPLQFVDPVTDTYNVGRIILQSNREHDFNWLLTVRRGPDGDARGVDVVVTFNKTIPPEDERAYSADFQTSGAGVDPFLINVHQDGGLVAPGGDVAEPFLKRGGYVLDLDNARWYRIREYSDLTTVIVNGVSAPGYQITLETPVVENSVGGKAVFLPGIVDVYPMGSLRLPKNF